MAVPSASRAQVSLESRKAMEENRRWRSTPESAELLAQYPDMWVATKDRGVVAAAKTYGELRRKLRARGSGQATIEYVNDPKYWVVYAVQ